MYKVEIHKMKKLSAEELEQKRRDRRYDYPTNNAEADMRMVKYLSVMLTEEEFAAVKKAVLGTM